MSHQPTPASAAAAQKEPNSNTSSYQSLTSPSTFSTVFPESKSAMEEINLSISDGNTELSKQAPGENNKIENQTGAVETLKEEEEAKEREEERFLLLNKTQIEQEMKQLSTPSKSSSSSSPPTKQTLPKSPSPSSKTKPNKITSHPTPYFIPTISPLQALENGIIDLLTLKDNLQSQSKTQAQQLEQLQIAHTSLQAKLLRYSTQYGKLRSQIPRMREG